MAAPAPALTSRHQTFWNELLRGARRAEESAGVDVRSIAIGGVRLQLRFAGQAVRDAHFPALAHLQDDQPGAPDVTISFWESSSAGVDPPASPFRPGDVVTRGVVEAGGDPSVEILCMPGLPIFMGWNAELAAAVVWVGDCDALPGHERASPIRTILHWALEPHDIDLVHGACVTGGGGGALIAGLSGAGKSTTAVACLERGLGFLGDDYVAVTAAEEAQALSLYSTAKLDRRSIELLGGLADIQRGKPVEDPPKEVLMLGRSRPERIAREASLRAIVVPSVSAPAGLRPAQAGTALRALAAPSILQIPQNGHRSMKRLAALVRGLPSFELGLGGDPKAAAMKLGGLCGA